MDVVTSVPAQCVTEEHDLGRAAQILMEDGKQQAAALLLDVNDLVYQEERDVGPDGYYRFCGAVLTVPSWLLPRFTDEVRGDILQALTEATRDAEMSPDLLAIKRVLPAPEGWRERVQGALTTDAPTNQARIVPIGERKIEEDRMLFRSRAELAVYRALRQRQEKLGLLIVPNTAVRVGGRTLEVDFLVCCQGRSGVIEVDGPYHRNRWASDRSRDRLLEDAGVVRVDRIAAEDTRTEGEVEAFIDRFLRLLVQA